LPDLQATRSYLVETLETTLELLAGVAVEDDEALYFHRLALFHEEMHAEGFAVLAQTLGLELGLVARVAIRAPRPPLFFPATRWLLGASGTGFRFDNEREPHPVDVPEFEIDAQAVTWAQYGEFVEDGGYDERSHWSEAGWAWLEREGRRTPRHVDQMRHGVLQRRFGVLARVPAAHPAVHVSWYEADAWCRWAGRRLPSEVEWETAAHQGASRGFRWGDVREWTASTFRPYPGFVAGPWRDYSLPAFGSHKVLRGASFATRNSLRSARFRDFALPERDDGFFGFRSCAA
jgi:ergothioneine biosynthesis protein EgtB